MKHSDFLKMDKKCKKVQTQMFNGSSTQQSHNMVKSSYFVTLLIANHMKPFSDGIIFYYILYRCFAQKRKSFSISLSHQTMSTH